MNKSFSLNREHVCHWQKYFPMFSPLCIFQIFSVFQMFIVNVFVIPKSLFFPVKQVRFNVFAACLKLRLGGGFETHNVQEGNMVFCACHCASIYIQQPLLKRDRVLQMYLGAARVLGCYKIETNVQRKYDNMTFLRFISLEVNFLPDFVVCFDCYFKHAGCSISGYDILRIYFIRKYTWIQTPPTLILFI